MSQSAAIEVDKLKKTYSEGWIRRRTLEALRGISFGVRQGEIFGLLGPNGAGKTTFIKILLGIVRRSSGSARLLGWSAGDRRSRQNVGYLPENLRIPRHLTGYTALELYGNLSGLNNREIRRRRTALLELVGLADRAGDSVRKYSKGMLQRLGLAQALLHDPQLLILDEPTDGLDPVARSQMRGVLAEIRRQGKTIFLNSHILQEVELICDRVAILDRGKLRYVGPVEEITTAAHRSAGHGLLEVELLLGGSEAVVRDALADQQPLSIQSGDNGDVRLTLRMSDQAHVDRLVDALRGRGVSIVALARRRVSLETAFLEILAEPAELIE